MWNYIWPIAIVVLANTVYHLMAKSTPADVQPFAALTVTYLTSSAVSFVLFLVTSPQKNFLTAVHKTNWTSIAFGISLVALEFGYIYVYRSGWKVGIGSLVANLCLAAVLLLIGVLFYKEHLSARQLIGVVLCIAGIILVNK
ncbi:MAG: EamA family transporter [Lachnospiraceae bacterium]